MKTRPLLLVHGYPFDHTLWDGVAAALPRDVQVLAPDLRGFGGQPTGSDEPALERMADDLKGLLDEKRITQTVIAGMSMGGYVALAFAERYPNLVAGFGLVSSQAAADTDEARANRRALIEKVRQDGPGVAAQAVIPKLFAAPNSGKADLLEFPRRGAERAGKEGIAWALEAMARRPDRTDVFKSLRVPVLVLHGAEDKFIPTLWARELAGRVRDGSFVEIVDAGHATPIEAPAAVAGALTRLVRRSYGPDPN